MGRAGMPSAGVVAVGQLFDQRRHFFELARPGGEVILQPLNHVETGLHRLDELSLRHGGQLAFQFLSLHMMVAASRNLIARASF